MHEYDLRRDSGPSAVVVTDKTPLLISSMQRSSWPIIEDSDDDDASDMRVASVVQRLPPWDCLGAVTARILAELSFFRLRGAELIPLAQHDAWLSWPNRHGYLPMVWPEIRLFRHTRFSVLQTTASLEDFYVRLRADAEQHTPQGGFEVEASDTDESDDGTSSTAASSCDGMPDLMSVEDLAAYELMHGRTPWD
jgi:hypothetical protein